MARGRFGGRRRRRKHLERLPRRHGQRAEARDRDGAAAVCLPAVDFSTRDRWPGHCGPVCKMEAETAAAEVIAKDAIAWGNFLTPVVAEAGVAARQERPEGISPDRRASDGLHRYPRRGTLQDTDRRRFA